MEYFESSQLQLPGIGLGEKALESRTNGERLSVLFQNGQNGQNGQNYFIILKQDKLRVFKMSVHLKKDKISSLYVWLIVERNHCLFNIVMSRHFTFLKVEQLVEFNLLHNYLISFVNSLSLFFSIFCPLFIVALPSLLLCSCLSICVSVVWLFLSFKS